jgi:hypothetical protein
MDFSESQINAIDSIVSLEASQLFLLGPPGYGKTTVIRQAVRKIREKNPEAKICIVAMSTVASEIIGEIDGIRATTFHRWWGLGKYSLRLDKIDQQGFLLDKLRTAGPQNPLNTEYLIIDEVSMLANTTVINMNTLLQEYRNNRNDDFGGMKVILIGDPLQLPPVPSEKGPGLDRDERSETRSVLDYFLKYAVYCILKEPHRNKDERFLKMVHRFVSNNADVRRSSAIELNSNHYRPGIKTIPDIVVTAINETAIVAAHTNAIVNQLNDEFKRRFKLARKREFHIPTWRRLFKDEDIISLDLDDPEKQAREHIQREEKAIANDRKRFYIDDTVYEGQLVQMRASFETKNKKDVRVGELCVFVEMRDDGVCVLRRKTDDEELWIGEHEGSSEYWEELKWAGYPFVPANACTNHLLQGATVPGKLIFYSDINGDIYGCLPFHLYVISSRVTDSSNFVITHKMDEYSLASRAVQNTLDRIWNLRYMQDYPQN